MSDKFQPAIAAPPNEPTDVRFSMRSILIVTAVVAGLAAVAGPFYRSASAETQRMLGIEWAGFLAFLLACVSLIAWHRYRAEQQAGRLLVRLPTYHRYFPRAAPWLQSMFAGLMIAIGLLILVASSIAAEETAPVRTSARQHVLRGFTPAFYIAIGLSLLWWRQSVRVCQRGLLLNSRIMLWTHVVEVRWQDPSPDVLHVTGIDQQGRDLRLAVRVPREQRAAVAELLQQHVRSSVSIATPTNVAVPPVVGHENQSADWLRVFAVVLLSLVYLVAHFAMVARSGSAAIDYHFSVVAAATLMSLWFVWHSRRAARRAGPQRRRLRTAPGWAAIVLAASVAAACYVVLYRMTDTDPWLTRGLAIVWGAAAVYSIALVIRKHLDLRDHGIVVQGGPFRLWTHVRRAEWDREKSGRLAFGRGWRRIVAVVPPEQRDAVEALLAEKLGEQTAPSEEG